MAAALESLQRALLAWQAVRIADLQRRCAGAYVRAGQLPAPQRPTMQSSLLQQLASAHIYLAQRPRSEQ
jgi:hypothetical protein